MSVLGHAAALAPHEAGALQAAAWNGILFSAFALHHSVMARTRAKQWIAAWLPSTLERSTYVWIASALFLATCLWWRRLPGEVYAAEGLWRWAGYGVQLGGLALITRSASMLDVLELAGIRQVSEPRTHPDAPPEPAAAPAGRPPLPPASCRRPLRDGPAPPVSRLGPHRVRRALYDSQPRPVRLHQHRVSAPRHPVGGTVHGGNLRRHVYAVRRTGTLEADSGGVLTTAVER